VNFSFKLRINHNKKGTRIYAEVLVYPCREEAYCHWIRCIATRYIFL